MVYIIVGDIMKLYLDLIFFLNFGFDFLLLLTVSVLLKRNVSYKRIFLGAFLGALSIFCLFIEISSLELFLIKIFIGILMILVTFSFKNIEYFLKNMGYFYMSSIILGGFLYYLNIEFSYKQDGLIFYHHGLSINVVFLVLFSPIVLYTYVKQNKIVKNNIPYYYKLSIVYNDKKYKLIGYLDTGNTLIDPYLNKPVCVVNKNIIKDVKEDEIIYVPVTTVSDSKLLRCIFVDIIFDDGSKFEKSLLAISDEKLNMDGVDVLLHKNIMEGRTC